MDISYMRGHSLTANTDAAVVFVNLDWDEVKELLRSYGELVAAGMGDSRCVELVGKMLEVIEQGDSWNNGI